VLRWWLPVFAVIALMCSSITSWAAAGMIGEPSCCCPDKAKCKCHDHDGEHNAAPTLKRCGGEAKWVAPMVSCAVFANPPSLPIEPRVTAVMVSTPEPSPDDRTIEPETPPF
jgi:hypothetical protein